MPLPARLESSLLLLAMTAMKQWIKCSTFMTTIFPLRNIGWWGGKYRNALRISSTAGGGLGSGPSKKSYHRRTFSSGVEIERWTLSASSSWSESVAI